VVRPPHTVVEELRARTDDDAIRDDAIPSTRCAALDCVPMVTFYVSTADMVDILRSIS
jgi:hypothetical protein